MNETPAFATRAIEHIKNQPQREPTRMEKIMALTSIDYQIAMKIKENKEKHRVL